MEHKEENSIQPEQQEEKRIIIIKKRKISRNLWDNFKCSNIHIIGEPEGVEQEQEIGNVFEKIMKDNFPKLVKEIGMQVQET